MCAKKTPAKKYKAKPKVRQKEVLAEKKSKVSFFEALNFFSKKESVAGKIAVATAVALFVYVFIINAWTGDDAYITFRTVDNFLEGHGLTWNLGERVQGYTHPLWLFVVTVFYAITDNIYFTAIALSFLFSISAVLFLTIKISGNYVNAMIAVLFLIFSKAFIDYTSSGLENPLTYLLCAVFVYVCLRHHSEKRLLWLSLISGFAMLNRADTVLLLIPALIYEVLRRPRFKMIGTLFIGFSPFIAWEIFSLIYYGFPFPNTAYAKLNTGIPFSEYLGQGFRYFGDSFRHDPLTLLTIFSALGLSAYYLIRKREGAGRRAALASGILLYLFYVIRIGGDFMSGRFFSAPFFIAVAIAASVETDFTRKASKSWLGFAIVLLIVGSIFSSSLPLFTSTNYGTIDGKRVDIFQYFCDDSGIADERAIYYPECGFIPVLRQGLGRPFYDPINTAFETNKSDFRTLYRGLLGMYGFYLDKDIYVIDQFGLTDPLLARLPQNPDPGWQRSDWRIGHFYRDCPRGYFESRSRDTNLIADERLAKLYDKLAIITGGELFSGTRIKEIWRFNTGAYSGLPHADYLRRQDTPIGSGDSNTIAVHYKKIGTKYFEQKKYFESLKYYRKALNLLPDNTDYYNNIIFLFILTGQLDSAGAYISDFKYLSGHADEKTEMLMRDLSKAYLKNNELEKAVEVLGLVIRLAPQSAMNHLLLGNVYYQAGRLRDARDSWLNAAELDSKMKDAWGNLFALYFYDLRDNKQAAFYARKLILNGGRLDPEIKKQLNIY